MKQEKPVGKTFKNVQVLKDLNDEQLNNTMQFVAASLGIFCDHCHVTTEQGNWPMERDDKKTKRTAREMMRMTLAINAQNFHGETVVTCATCHQGHQEPNGIPPLELAIASASAPASATLPTVGHVFDRYVQALGGDAALGKFNSRVMKGTLTGGPFPEQTDFADYRPVNGVQFPFTIRRMEINSKWTEKYRTIELNVPLDDAIFVKQKPQSP
jgi:hypothetical protein